MTAESLTSLSSAFRPDQQSAAMVFLRMCLYMGTILSNQPDLFNKLGPTCFAAYLHSWLVVWAPDTPPGALTLAMHRHVIFIGLLRAKSQALPGTSSITAEYLRGALERVLAPVAQYLRFKNAAHAAETVNKLLIPIGTQLAEFPLAVEMDFNLITLRVHAVRAVLNGGDALGA